MATRWGICSVGKISHDFSAALRTLVPEDHKIVAVASRDLQRAKEFAKRHKIPRTYGSYEELAQDPDIDVVYIGTIHPQHFNIGKLFINAQKNVLIEKPLGMNVRQVQELITAAQEKKVFLMEAVWARFFPAYAEVRRLLEQGEVGDVQMVRAEFGLPVSYVRRMSDRKLGGGGLVDLGIYPLQFAFMVFKGEKPESIHASGHCLETGVDDTAVVVLKFSGNRLAICTCSISMKLVSDAVIVGTKGTIKLPHHMWCPTELEVNGKEMHFPLPETDLPLNYVHSAGLRYEGEEVRRCLLKGLKESAEMPWAHSILLTETLDEARRQMGVIYDQDKL